MSKKSKTDSLNQIKRLITSGRLEEADHLLTTLMNTPSSTSESLFLLAKVRELRNMTDGISDILYEVIAQDVNHIDAHIMLAKQFLLESNYYKALETCEHILSLDEKNLEALNSKSIAHRGLYQVNEAINCLQFALLHYPNNSSVYINLGNLHGDLANIEDAIVCYKAAIKLNNQDSLAYSNISNAVHYHPDYSFEEINHICMDWSRYFKIKPQNRKIKRQKDAPKHVLNIGLISDGFRRHPVGYMASATLEELSDQHFNLFAYSTNNEIDDITTRIKSAVYSWHPVSGLSNRELYNLIKKHQIDVLIDLAGHMSGSRMQTIAMKPAPVIVKWVGGLINTTGVDAIDYLISDHIETPEGIDPYYVEKLIRLPNDYICYEPPLYAPEVGPLPCDSNGYITFGCFNNGTKINLELLTQWADILKQVKDSRLLLKSTQYNAAELKNKIWDHFEQLGIDSSRIMIEGPSKHTVLLDTYNRVDIALDSWPYSGGLTTCEALYMGVPVITYPGPTFAGRHSATHLHNAGMAELIADSWDSFKTITIGLTQDIDSLRIIRKNLRTVVLNSPLCDVERFAKDFSFALSAIWQRHCSGKAPEALSFSDSLVAQFRDESSPVQIQQTEAKSRSSKVKMKEQKKGEFAWQFSGQVVVIDNACSLLSHQKLASLRALGAFAIVNLDPTNKLTNASEFASDKNIEIHQHVDLGDGTQKQLHACLDNRFSSVLKPLQLATDSKAPTNPAQVLANLPIPTVALDQIKGLPSLDVLILSTTSDINTILNHGTQALAESYILQVGVSFKKTHEDQAELNQINAWAESNGFRFYTLANQQFNRSELTELGLDEQELLSADAIYIPTDKRLEKMTPREIEKFAFICDRLFEFKGFAHQLLTQFVPEKAEDYLAHAIASVTMPSKVILDEVIANNKPLLPKPHGLEGKLIVSLTSYPKRFKTLANTLRCLLNQTITPDHIVLWIAHADKEELPKEVVELRQFGIQIKFCDDFGSYKKILPSIDHFGECFIATADDDIYYWPTWLEELVNAYDDSKLDIPAHRVHKIELNSKLEPMSYRDWQWNVKATNQSHPLYFATSGAGVLYPPKVLKEIAQHKKEINALCKNTDDIWLFWTIRMAGYQYKHTGSQKLMALSNLSSKDVIDNAQMDDNCKRMADKFSLSIFCDTQAANNDSDQLSVPSAPFMSPAEQVLFKQYLKDATSYYEFGSGGSTVWAVKQGLDVLGIESDMTWITALKTNLGEKCKIDFADIGPTGDWGYPRSLQESHKFPAYSSSILNHDVNFDLILIDGRFRVACLFATLIYLLTKHESPCNVKIFIHDFWNRQESYSPVLDYLEEVASAESAGVFTIKSNAKLDKVQRMWEKFSKVPE